MKIIQFPVSAIRKIVTDEDTLIGKVWETGFNDLVSPANPLDLLLFVLKIIRTRNMEIFL